MPEWEQISLQDYRLRQAQYHQGDEGLRNLRRRAPLMAVWDDHETANVSSELCVEIVCKFVAQY